MTPEQMQTRLDALLARRDEIIDGKEVRATKIDGLETEYFKADLKTINNEIDRLECLLNKTSPTRRRRPIRVDY